MDISQKAIRHHSPQLQPEMDYLADYYHVNNQEIPLCSQSRQFVYLCSKEVFEALPPSMKCTRCQWLIGQI